MEPCRAAVSVVTNATVYGSAATTTCFAGAQYRLPDCQAVGSLSIPRVCLTTVRASRRSTPLPRRHPTPLARTSIGLGGGTVRLTWVCYSHSAAG